MNAIKAVLGRAAAVLLAASMLPALASCGGPAVTPARSATPVIFDTDMAGDDIMALCYLLERRGINVAAITVEGTGEAHGLAGARNVLRLMRALGIHRDVPVAYGQPDPLSGFRSFPLAWRAAADGMYNLNLPPWRGNQPSESAVRLIVDTVNRSAQPVVLVTLGPLTNIAQALRSDPGIAHKIAMIYSMAGAVRVNGNEPVHQRAEWNVYVDAAAADQVLRSGVPMTFVPLDASDSVPITPAYREVIGAHARTPALRIVAKILSLPYYMASLVYFWDPLAAVAATSHSAVRLRTVRLSISAADGPDMGVTRISPSGSAVRVAVSASAAAFDYEYLATLDGGRPIPMPVVPASQHAAVSFDGSNYRYDGPSSAMAGRLEIQLANSSPAAFDGFQLAIGKLASGRTLQDVQDVIRRGTATSVPGWFHVTSVLPAANGAAPAWTVSLTPGTYALVCQRERDGALYALAQLIIR
jgi:inosine-uridine nucleoside N-ribohydrolase